MKQKLPIIIGSIAIAIGTYIILSGKKAYSIDSIARELASKYNVSYYSTIKRFKQLGIGTTSEKYSDIKVKAHKNIHYKYGAIYGVNPSLSMAIEWIESQGSPYTLRYEPKLKDTSVGLMQILTSTGCEICGKCSINSLRDVDSSIKCGIKYIAKLKNRYNNITDIISAYNAGRPIKGNIVSYVIPVLKKYNDYKKII